MTQDPPSGRKILGNYELLEVIGTGAQGSVYKAHCIKSGPRVAEGDLVAVKVLSNRGAGDPIERVTADPQRVSVREVMGLLLNKEGDEDLLRRALKIESLTQKYRVRFERRLAASRGRMDEA